MQILDAGVPEGTLERFAVEMRMAPRAWESAYVDQTFDSRPLEQGEEILEGSCRMSDRVDRHGIGGPPGGGALSPRMRSTTIGRSALMGRSCNASFAMWYVCRASNTRDARTSWPTSTSKSTRSR